MNNPFKRKKYKLRNLDVTRVDLVDNGANQYANIILAKADEMKNKAKDKKSSTRPSASPAARPTAGPSGSGPPGGGAPQVSQQDRARALVERMRARGVGSPGAGPPEGAPSQPSGGQRIARFSPTDFEVVSNEGNMTEWTLKPDKLPEGIEEVSVLMAQGNDGQGSYQWVVDPKAGPPEEGTAKTPAEAFMAIRAKLTQHNAGFGSELGGFPAPLEAMTGNPMMQRQRNRTAVALRAVNALRKKADMVELEPLVESIKSAGQTVTVTRKANVAATDPVDLALAYVAKGLADVDIFVEDVTGDDLRGILPQELLDELSSKLSANAERRGNQEEQSDG